MISANYLLYSSFFSELCNIVIAHKYGIKIFSMDLTNELFLQDKNSNSSSDDYSLKYKKAKHSSLGSGGNGDVKKVFSIETGEMMALKSLNKEAKAQKEKKLRFEDEIKTMLEASKQMKGVIPIIDYSINGCWYVMPIAESIVKHRNSIDEIINGVIQIAETLVKLHEMGLSHRDIKPDNMLFYKDRWVLCDFGLVDIPNNPNNLTKVKERVGAIKTIAPEMSRNAKDADGKKADVYSLAKSLWIMLTKNDDSFEGHYDVTDDTMSLHHYGDLKDKHLIEIDELLDAATNNNPSDRPTMIKFVEILKKWQKTKSDIVKQQISNWKFLKKYLFYGNGPQRCMWEDPVEINRVLNLISHLPLCSHIFFPNSGWMEYKKVEIGTEPSCLDIYMSLNVIYRMRLGRLYYENFQLSFWNYFMLETEPVDPVVGTEVNEYFERVVEDKPGHFVSAVDAIYGVYNYDDGIKLPQEAKVLIRCLKGKFLIVLKHGAYNQIVTTDDGRHNNCSNDEFRKYMEDLQNLFVLPGLVTENIWKTLYNNLVNKYPFKTQNDLPKLLKEQKFKNNQNFVKGNWASFNFKEIIDQHHKMSAGKAKYGFAFHQISDKDFLEILMNEKEYYLCKDGFIREMTSDAKDIYEATNRKTAIEIYKELEKTIANYCKGKAFDQPYFTIRITKVITPKNLFSIDDIKKLMMEADDRVNNTLVIDEDGYPHILTDQSEAKFYPVVNETWHERNNYVGKYSNLPDLKSAYHYSLGKWRDYLKNGVGQAMDDYDDYLESDEELIKDIQTIIEKDYNKQY